MMLKYILCFGIIGWLLAFPSVGQTNRALIVTVSEYPKYSGWENLHSFNDEELVLSLLEKQRFDKNNVTALSNKDATKAAIINALESICNKALEGDYIYLHFSCHGQQMADDNGDEDDGLDEALIPYDASFWYVPGKYEGENHLRDDELGVWISKLRERVGAKGYVAIVADACHSGTVNRAPGPEDYIRGTASIFGPDDYIPTPGKHPELSLHLLEKEGLAPAIIFSACLPEETNYEYYNKETSRYFGFLTYAFCDVVRNIPANMTMGEALKSIKKKMKQLKPNARNRKQTPYMECTNSKTEFKIGF